MIAVLCSVGCAMCARVIPMQQPTVITELRLGDHDAKNEVIVYVSMTCAHCAQFVVEDVKKFCDEHKDCKIILRFVPAGSADLFFMKLIHLAAHSDPVRYHQVYINLMKRYMATLHKVRSPNRARRKELITQRLKERLLAEMKEQMQKDGTAADEKECEKLVNEKFKAIPQEQLDALSGEQLFPTAMAALGFEFTVDDILQAISTERDAYRGVVMRQFTIYRSEIPGDSNEVVLPIIMYGVRQFKTLKEAYEAILKEESPAE
jgi:protein-disulfide isomerase